VVRTGSSLLGSAQSLAWRDLGLAAADSAVNGGSRDLHARTTATRKILKNVQKIRKTQDKYYEIISDF
jgi:hypothetical protein